MTAPSVPLVAHFCDALDDQKVVIKSLRVVAIDGRAMLVLHNNQILPVHNLEGLKLVQVEYVQEKKTKKDEV